jgi:hypothetical protein
MTELDLRQSPWNEGLGISSEFLDHQLYLLGCMVHASAAIEKLGQDPLRDLRQQFQEAEIGRLLLTVAVAVRNAMDQNPSRASYWLQGVDGSVGKLKLLRSKKKTESVLNFREACNKLIHCLSINFDYKSKNPKRGMALNPVVHLYGTKGEQEWKATIEINKFIGVATQLT